MPHRIPVTHRNNAYSPPTDEQIARSRQMYVDKYPVSRILAACEMSHGTFYYWLDGGPREADGPRLPPIPRRRVVVGKRRPPLAQGQVSLVARLWRTAERQVRDIELRLSQGAQPPAERERDMRMMVSAVRMLRELSGFAVAKPKPGEEEDAAPRDMDEFRRELARRMDALVARRDERQASAAPAGEGE